MSLVNTVHSFLTTLEAADAQSGADALQRPLVVGVSGGPDSVALLHILACRRLYPSREIVVAHLNHKLRPEAAADASFVQALAVKWQLRYFSAEIDVGELARTKGLSVEAAGREARYEFLAQVALETGAIMVATGHNRNDQAETVLMHILRGSGLTGLRGMQQVAPLPGAPEIRLIRPLMAASRDEIEAYCQEQGLDYVQDDTNRDVSLFRNRLRHELLPQLAGYDASIVDHLHRLASVVNADEELLAKLTADAWKDLLVTSSAGRISLDLLLWRALPLSLRRRTLRLAVSIFSQNVTEISFETTELARNVAETGQTGDKASLPGALMLEVGYEQLVFLAPAYQEVMSDYPQLAAQQQAVMPVPGRLQLTGGWAFSVEAVDSVPYEVIERNPDPWRAYISIAFADDLYVRPRLIGERIRPLGMGGQSAKLSDVMTNRKIKSALRDRWPILSTSDHALWLAGHVLDERAHVGPDDNRALLVRLERISERPGIS